MKFLKRLLAGPAGDADSGTDAGLLWYYVRCNRCGETIAIMARKGYDLVEEFAESSDESSGGDAPSGYSLYKDAMGRSDTCFQKMRIEIHFNLQYVEESRHIEGGTFITAEEYRAAQPGETEA